MTYKCREMQKWNQRGKQKFHIYKKTNCSYISDQEHVCSNLC
jgi:hypothetical protein